MIAWTRVVLALSYASLAACGPDAADDSAPDASDECGDKPVESYDTFGKPFLTFHCQGCHASTTENRLGAPPDITFDDAHQVFALRERILARASGDSPSMPPAGGTTEEERAKLDTWLRCFETR